MGQPFMAREFFKINPDYKYRMSSNEICIIATDDNCWVGPENALVGLENFDNKLGS